MYVKVEVHPGAKKESVTKTGVDSFTIAVREKAERNLANRRVLELLARHHNVRIGKVRLISGHRSVRKIFSIEIEKPL